MNPADQLAEILSHWHVPPNSTIYAARDFEGDPENLDLWRRQAHAIELVARVDQLLAGMDGAGEHVSETFLPVLARWYRGVFQPDHSWGQQHSAELQPIDDADTRLLRSLAHLLDTGRTLDVSPDARDEMLDRLNEAQTLLEQDTGLSTEAKRYLWSLIVEARRVLLELDDLEDLNHFDPDHARSVVFEIGGALYARGEDLKKAGDTAGGGAYNALALAVLGGFGGAAGTSMFHLAADAGHKLLGGG